MNSEPFTTDAVGFVAVGEPLVVDVSDNVGALAGPGSTAGCGTGGVAGNDGDVQWKPFCEGSVLPDPFVLGSTPVNPTPEKPRESESRWLRRYSSWRARSSSPRLA
ncbi:hypothetical protein B0T44_11155 [Nocardia donostiensis]|uniref:Uncharacterized protein n=1 Tax=Nocardia donostiensis TaxID=1538463 RepID=A0A1V2TC79_9NOCA|nr:hypothetical protein B0T46_19165 [Nocardia donostiensis]OQS20089.1 hypothetical protein B0T44_11155 [Nocardia donostiensis]